jgi:hypothetical protein
VKTVSDPNLTKVTKVAFASLPTGAVFFDRGAGLCLKIRIFTGPAIGEYRDAAVNLTDGVQREFSSTELVRVVFSELKHEPL